MTMLIHFTKKLCPYCFEYFKLKEAPFRCVGHKCPKEADSVLKNVWGDDLPYGKILSPPEKLFANSVRCLDCNQESHKRLCPHCHMELPHTIDKFKNYIFSVIGAKAAGKSHYIAVLINELKKRIGPDMNILLEPLNEKTIQRYRNDFYDPLFKQKRPIDATMQAMTNTDVQMPMIFSLTFSKKGWFGKDKITGAIVLVFFDTAGEDLNDQDTMSMVNKYIYRSDGLILLIDPLQLSEIRDSLPKSTALPVQYAETADILTRTTRLIENGRKLKPTDTIPIPLAVAFSKFDAISPLLDPQLQISAAANHRTGFDKGDFDAINSEMIALLS
jgi:GTPase SAR1 family protein